MLRSKHTFFSRSEKRLSFAERTWKDYRSRSERGKTIVRGANVGKTIVRGAKLGTNLNTTSDAVSMIEDSSARPLWARFYDIQSNRPLFCDRDGVPKYNIEEIGSERRGGYSWYGNWGESLATAYAKWAHR